MALFISRYIDRNDYGVVDEDDNSEQVCSPEDIIKAETYGILILGYDPVAIHAAPYQRPESRSKEQIKLEMLSHVRVTVWRQFLTSVTWEANAITVPVRVRISDFSTKIAEFVLRGNPCSYEHKITLVFDDKLEDIYLLSLAPCTLHQAGLGVDGLGVAFDLREVTNSELAMKIYRSLGYGTMSEKTRVSITRSIIDHAARKRRMIQRWFGG